jgi:hypothetical protein
MSFESSGQYPKMRECLSGSFLERAKFTLKKVERLRFCVFFFHVGERYNTLTIATFLITIYCYHGWVEITAGA